MNELVKLNSDYIEKTNNEAIEKLKKLIEQVKKREIFIEKITESFGNNKTIKIDILEIK